jgi:hypothetical protein
MNFIPLGKKTNNEITLGTSTKAGKITSAAGENHL